MLAYGAGLEALRAGHLGSQTKLWAIKSRDLTAAEQTAFEIRISNELLYPS